MKRVEGEEGKKEEEEECVIPDNYSEGAGVELVNVPDIPDDEIDKYINSTEEVETKTKMWEEMNSDYLEQQKLKQEKGEKGEKSGTKRKRKTEKKKPSENTAEAMSDMLKKKVSAKINYSALEGLFTNVPGGGEGEGDGEGEDKRGRGFSSVLEFEDGAKESGTHYDPEYDDDYDDYDDY